MAERIKYLHERLGERAYDLDIQKRSVSSYVSDNLKYEFFNWQKLAFENLLTFDAIREKEETNNKPTHLMFNMATGTGKTLLMAACLLYYYKQGYKELTR